MKEKKLQFESASVRSSQFNAVLRIADKWLFIVDIQYKQWGRDRESNIK